MEKQKLIDILYDQLLESKNFDKIEKGSYDDGSGSWIECYHSINPNKQFKRYNKCLSFNGEGTVLENIQVWEETMDWDLDNMIEL